jgi:cell wall-associated NlpC family hydrolase
MTTARTTLSRRSFRGLAVTALAGAGLVLAPLPASADTGGAGTTAVAVAAPAAAANGAAQKAVDTALAQVGDPYSWGATGPNAFDCSGLTSFSYKAAGVTIPRTSKAQSTFGTPVSKANLQPGDLVFFYSPVSHVGMYIGNGQMVHAPSSGSTVKVVKVDSMPSFAGARRVA